MIPIPPLATLRLIGAALLLAGAFWGGWTVATWRCEAREAERLADATAARDAELERVAGVSAAYQAVAAELRRLQAVNRVEVNRETVRVEYRCPLPDAGRVLLDRAIDSANGAAGSAATVPADRQAPGR